MTALGWHAIPIFEQDAFPASKRQFRHPSVQATHVASGDAKTLSSGAAAGRDVAGFDGGRSVARSSKLGSQITQANIAKALFMRPVPVGVNYTLTQDS